ncbi:hypothetical protein PFHG_05638 [Plasmodium falciparum HB3]|uniref:Uncharacterized protein n=1 Tax=Plasmodium falciparum (isolate HB3) TaxID=137071 RepID=A0A0L7K927_PLAFX|nr:hypothetical protein PFHG_05638 [Plasmodium falciparum HB3]
MEEFFKKQKYYDVREIFSFIRENSQIKLDSSFYGITIKSMLMLKNHSIEEAIIIYKDSYNMSIYFTNEIHNFVLCNIYMLEPYLYYYPKGRSKEETSENIRSLEYWKGT